MCQSREMHRDVGYWGEDANEWRPERWETARPGPEYVPFSAGPRYVVLRFLELERNWMDPTRS